MRGVYFLNKGEVLFVYVEGVGFKSYTGTSVEMLFSFQDLYEVQFYNLCQWFHLLQRAVLCIS